MKVLKINNKLNSLDKIYNYYKFNPVEHSLNKKEFAKLFKQRTNLFEDHLKIPINYFNNKKILEFGPANGEKTLIYGKLGSRITVVEPNKKFLTKLKKNFKKHKIKFKSYNTYIEKFKTKEKFDFIILENFLTSISKRDKVFRNVSSLLNKNGIMIFSYHNPDGFFFEYLKKFLLEAYLEINKVNKINEILTISKKFFKKKFNKISHTRSFEKYALDTLILNNFLHKTFWKFDKILKLANRSNLRFYSSWPNYMPHQSNWHKQDISHNEFNQLILKNYKNIRGNFVCRDHYFEKEDMKLISKIFQIMYSNLKKKNSLRLILNLLKSSKLKKKSLFVKLFKVMNNLTPKSYNKYFNFNDWGYPNHYLSFIKK